GGLPDYFKAAPRAVAGDPEDPEAFFVGMTDGSIWMSDDDGQSFRQIVKDLPPVMSIGVTH
ncbi:MAG: exo-alpha-sialidase, partial [Deltaproteobacteria bacterium]|nr:exo-alpha-sialidase [Deltaproteobacteria bacterium]